MHASDDTLARLESWFQGQVVGPHESRAKTFDERNAAARAHIRPSSTLQPAERIAVYADMYFARLVDVLGEEFPAVRALCGPVEFERLVRAYLREHPSTHWSLNGLGRKLPLFLAGPFRIPRKALLQDVARIEDAIAVVFDAPRSPVMVTADMARVRPEAFATARVRLIDALQLFELDHRANAVVRALRQGETLPPLGRMRTRTVVWRKEWIVWRMDLDAFAFHALSALRSGETVQAAIEAGARQFEGPPEELQARIGNAFGEWISEGMLASVETG